MAQSTVSGIDRDHKVLYFLDPAFPWRYNFRAIILAPSVVSYFYLCVERPRMAPKLWRQSYGAKGMHAFIDYQRSVICYHQILARAIHRLPFQFKNGFLVRFCTFCKSSFDQVIRCTDLYMVYYLFPK